MVCLPVGEPAACSVYHTLMHDPSRLTVIEEKLAYLEQHLGDLDEVVQELAKRMAKQGEGVTAVRKMLEDHLSEADGPSDPADEKPPHW